MIEAIIGVSLGVGVFFLGYFVGRAEEREAHGIGEKK